MNRKLPPLNALKSFEAAARLRSIRGAAAELMVSHSAVSHQIKKLEQYLETDLFVRHPKSVELTEVGEEYFLILKDAFDRIAHGTNVLTHPQQRNVLTIQTYSTIAVRWLVLRLEKFTKANPDLEIRLITSQENPDFKAKSVDAAIMIGRPSEQGLETEYLFTPKMFPVCSPSLLSGEAPLRVPSDLEKHEILQVYPSKADWQAWLEKYRVSDINITAGLNFDSYDHALKTAARGLGVALGMQPYVHEDLATGLLVRPFGDLSVPAPFSWHYVAHKHRRASNKVSRFRNWLIAEIESDPDLSVHRVTEQPN